MNVQQKRKKKVHETAIINNISRGGNEKLIIFFKCKYFARDQSFFSQPSYSFNFFSMMIFTFWFLNYSNSLHFALVYHCKYFINVKANNYNTFFSHSVHQARVNIYSIKSNGFKDFHNLLPPLLAACTKPSQPFCNFNF